MKKILIALVLVTLVGCTAPNLKPLTTVCTKEYISVLYVPAPPVIEPVDVPLDDITPEKLASDGELSKYMVASVKALEDYAHDLEKVIADYKDKHDKAEAMKQQIIAAGNKITAADKPVVVAPSK